MNREEIIRLTALRRWGVRNDAGPDDDIPPHMVPTEPRLAEWLPDCPPQYMREASTRLRMAFALGASLGLLDTPHAREADYFFEAVDLRHVNIKPNDEVTDPLALVVARQDPGSGTPVLLMTIDRLYDHVSEVQRALSKVRTPNGGPADTPEILQPLTPLIDAWQETGLGKPISEVCIKTAGGLSRRPYEMADLVRTPWEDTGIDGFVNAVKVHGLAVAARMSAERSRTRSGRLLKPAGTEGQVTMAGFGRGRDALAQPTVIWAYAQFAGDRKRMLGEDVVTLIELAHLFDEPVMWAPRQLVAVMARKRDGGFRTPKETDFERLMKATAAARALLMPVKDSRGKLWWHDVVDVSQDSRRRRIRLGRPMWAMTRRGRFTLTATLGACGRPRFAGHQALRRAITGLEYWFARSAAPGGKGTAADLLPDHPGGPGPWRKMKMQQFLEICGEPLKKMSAGHRRQAFKMIRDRLAGSDAYHSYVVPGGRTTKAAPAGDTVEVCLDNANGTRLRGSVLVRASAVFCEAARLAQEGRYVQVSAREYLGRPRILSASGQDARAVARLPLWRASARA